MNIKFKDLTSVNESIIKLGLSARGFGKLSGISHGQIHDILKGERQVTALMAKRICTALGKEFDEIFFIDSGYKSEQKESA